MLFLKLHTFGLYNRYTSLPAPWCPSVFYVCDDQKLVAGVWWLDNLVLQIRKAAQRSKGKTEEEELRRETMWTSLDNAGSFSNRSRSWKGAYGCFFKDSP